MMLLKDNGNLDGPGIHKPTGDIFDRLDDDEKMFILTFRDEMMSLFQDSPEESFHYLKDAMLDNDEIVALWSILPSHVRSAYKKWTRTL